MPDSVIVLVANEAYLPQVKSLMVNCVRQGNWKGDFCLIVADDRSDGTASDFTQRGIDVMRTTDPTWTMQTKFWVFHPYFKQWDRVLCLDCDMLAQGDLNLACDKLAEKFPAICCDGCQQPEDGPVVRQWEHFDDHYGQGKGRAAHPELYDKLYARFDCMDKLSYTVDIMFFSPTAIPDGTVENLQAIQEEFKEANQFNIDQPVTVTALYDLMAPVTKEFGCWFAFDEPSHRVASRGWTGNEEPVLLHYFGWFAPWIVKEEGAGGHYNHRLGRVCHEIYAENLAAFEEEFPVI